MLFNSQKIVFVSSNYFLCVAIEKLVCATSLSGREFTREYIYQYLGDSIVIFDLSNIQDIASNIKNLGMLRMISPTTKVVLIKAVFLNLRFLNGFSYWEVNSSIESFEKIVIKRYLKGSEAIANGEVKRKALTSAQVNFLYLYSQGMPVPEIAKKLKIPLKTAYSRKTLLWRIMEVHREINITYLLPHFKDFLLTHYSRKLDSSIILESLN
ncbi:hypothetical protein HAX39_24465 [Citrobacter freundii]|nr:hypothetical protein [Citrobacter freundii]